MILNENCISTQADLVINSKEDYSMPKNMFYGARTSFSVVIYFNKIGYASENGYASEKRLVCT